MRPRIHIALLLFAALALFPSRSSAGEAADLPLLRDDVAGYAVFLPSPEWREITDARLLEEQFRRIGSVFMQDGEIKGAERMRAAYLPNGGPASPALILFTLDYASLGLNEAAVVDISKKPQNAASSMANALQTSYLQKFPQSVMLNHNLGDMSFTLNLRSVLDAADEAGTTLNRRVKMMLSAQGAVFLMTQYDGPPDVELDRAVSFSVREMVILPDHSLEKLRPPYQTSFMDYVLVCVAIVVALLVIRRFRRR